MARGAGTESPEEEARGEESQLRRSARSAASLRSQKRQAKRMMAIFVVLLFSFMIWNGLLMDWARALATGLAQLAIWSTLLSLVPFVSLWANLRAPLPGSSSDNPQSTLRTHWTLLL